MRLYVGYNMYTTEQSSVKQLDSPQDFKVSLHPAVRSQHKTLIVWTVLLHHTVLPSEVEAFSTNAAVFVPGASVETSLLVYLCFVPPCQGRD